MTTQELSVGTLTRLIKEVLEEDFRIVRVVGEVSNYKLASSGHQYFNLKDDEAQIRCVMWKSRAPRVQPSDGMRVVVSGRLTVYPPSGGYQIDCTSLEPAGVGDLYIAFEKLKKDLTALGYFDQSRKRPIPVFPQAIGIATSANGAVIHDILTTLRERMPLVRVYFRPTLVQGPGSIDDIVNAIEELHSHPCDVIIVGRGGGSIEDLWSFNTRPVADAIYNSRLPIISAVGHETDVCIADMVADYRASTPSLAAIACSRVTVDDLRMRIDDIASNISDLVIGRVRDMSAQAREWRDGTVRSVILRQLRYLRAHVRAEQWSDGMVQDAIVRRLGAIGNEMQQMHASMIRSSTRTIREGKQQVAHNNELLRSLRPLAPLERGFALVYKNGRVVPSDEVLNDGDIIDIQRRKDRITARVQ